ncbi:flavodoxin family protein [Lactobacillus agrestimuris]|uniref:flavodoxin family protein n=1 Tax=Lactobacillus agrestimuris TaxID=2941328 RepID=UPI0020438336|nr:flavodoxin family protein [Lactobacillus agrestimuris]
MKVLVILGSTQRPGSSTTLAEAFSKGAKEAGHEVTIYDAAKNPITPLEVDINKHVMPGDENTQHYLHLLQEADAVVFATPLYYFGMSAQMKAAVDRFYEDKDGLKGDKYGVLLATGWGDSFRFDNLVGHYHALLHFMKWIDAGYITAQWSDNVDLLKQHDYIEQAYKIGRHLGEPIRVE